MCLFVFLLVFALTFHFFDNKQEVPVIAIAFNLIIIRADRQSEEEYTLPSTMGSIPLHNVHSLKAGTVTTATMNTEQRRPMQVAVIRETDLEASHYPGKATEYSSSRSEF